MSKSTLESLEKVIKKFLAPIETKIGCIFTELKRIEDKISKLETTKQKCIKCDKPPASNYSPKGSDAPKPRAKTPAATTKTTAAASRAVPAATNDRRSSLPAAGNVNTRATTNATTKTDATKTIKEPASKPERTDETDHDTGSNIFPKPADNDDDGPWQVTTYKKSRKQLRQSRVAVTGTGPIDDVLETTERRKKIHACFFKYDTTREAIESYIAKKSNNTDCTVEKLQLKHQHYASFAITVPQSLFETLMSASYWPPRTEVSEWFRYGTGRAWRAPSRHPRRATGAGPAPEAESAEAPARHTTAGN